jgi:hypothetical protein
LFQFGLDFAGRIGFLPCFLQLTSLFVKGTFIGKTVGAVLCQYLGKNV